MAPIKISDGKAKREATKKLSSTAAQAHGMTDHKHGSIIDYFYSQPDEVQRILMKAAIRDDGTKVDWGLGWSIAQEQLGERYTESELNNLWTAVQWMMR